MLTYSQQQLCLQMKTNHKQDTDMLSPLAFFFFFLYAFVFFLPFTPFPSSRAMTLCVRQDIVRITGGEHLDGVCFCVCAPSECL